MEGLSGLEYLIFMEGLSGLTFFAIQGSTFKTEMVAIHRRTVRNGIFWIQTDGTNMFAICGRTLSSKMFKIHGSSFRTEMVALHVKTVRT